MKLDMLFEGWEELGIADPDLDGLKTVYTQIGYYHSLDVDEAMGLVINLLNKKGFRTGNFSLVPGTIEANEDELGANKMKFLEVDIEIDQNLVNIIKHKRNSFSFVEPFPSWRTEYGGNFEDDAPVQVVVTFDPELSGLD